MLLSGSRNLKGFIKIMKKEDSKCSSCEIHTLFTITTNGEASLSSSTHDDTFILKKLSFIRPITSPPLQRIIRKKNPSELMYNVVA